MFWLSLALQASIAQATVPAIPPALPERLSILAPNCPGRKSADDEILVCARGQDSQQLPLPAERGPPDHPVPSNPDMSASYALGGGPSCAALVGGCQVGFNPLGPPVMLARIVQKLVNPASDCCVGDEATNPFLLVRDGVRAASRMGRKKPDRSNRVAIPLEDDPIPPLRP